MWHLHKLKPISDGVSSRVFSLEAAVMIFGWKKKKGFNRILKPVLDLGGFRRLGLSCTSCMKPLYELFSMYLSHFSWAKFTKTEHCLLSVLLPIRHHSHLHAVVSEVCRRGVHPRFYEDLSENPWLVPRLHLHALQHLNCTGNDTHQVGRGRCRVAGSGNSRSVPGPFHIFRRTNVDFSVNFFKMLDLTI